MSQKLDNFILAGAINDAELLFLFYFLESILLFLCENKKVLQMKLSSLCF